jgi:D-3-phosphoglycerate dehydrogenase
MGKILITDAAHPILIEEFARANYVCDYLPDITLQEVNEVIQDYVGIIINSKILMDKNLIDKGLKLKFIARLGSGREVIDIPYAASKGIQTFFSPEGNSNAVAEHALGMLLALANNFLKADREVRQKIWRREENRGWELRGKTIGIIGFGHTGTAFARKLKSMEMTMLVYDKYLNEFENEYDFVKKVSLEELQRESDVISFHLPLTPETKHFCDSDFFDNCKKKPIVINTSRGNVVKTASLLEALQERKIKGACLDVFENEKVQTFTPEDEVFYSILYEFPNVILSPHVAGWTHESKKLLSQVLLEKILKNVKKDDQH